MCFRHFHDADASAVAERGGGIFLQEGDETAAAADGERVALRLRKDGLQFLEALVEGLQGHAEERGGDHRFDDHVLLFQLYAGLAGEDEELAERVAAAKVQARIGLGEPGFLRRLDKRRERGPLSVGAENLVQGAGDDGLDGADLVAAVCADGKG